MPDFGSGSEILEFGSGGYLVVVDVETVQIAGIILNRSEGYLFQNGLSGYFAIGNSGITALPSSGAYDFGDSFQITANQTWTSTNSTINLMGGFSGEFNITKNGTGTVVLSGNSTRSSAPVATILNAGVLELSAPAALNTSPNAPLIMNGGVLKLVSDAGTTFTGTNITVSGNSSVETGAFSEGEPHPLHTVGDLRIGSQSLTVDRSGITTGEAILQAGSLMLTGQAVFNINTNVVLRVGAVAESGSNRGITKSGNGTLFFTGNSVYSGATTISAGTLEIASGGLLGGGNHSAGIANSGSFVYSGNASQRLSGIVSGTGNLTQNGAGSLTLAGNNSFTGAIAIVSGTLEIAPTGRLGAGNYSANISNSGSFIYSSTGNQILSGILSGSGSFTQNGSSVLTLTRSNTYAGPTIINSGTLSIASITNGGVSGPLGSSSSSAGNLVLAGGRLAFTGSSSSSDRSFTLANGTTGTIEVGNASSTLMLSGSSAATSGALVKAGGGALVLGGNAGHTGGTTVSAGTLRVNGTHASAITVQSGAILSGNGSISGLVTLNSGATLTPGNSVGIFNFSGGLTLNSNSTVTMEIDSASSFDTINVTGGVLVYDGALSLVFAEGYTPAVNSTYQLFTGSSVATASGNFMNLVFNNPEYLGNYSATTGVLTLTAIPEPGTLGLLGLGSLIFCLSLWKTGIRHRCKTAKSVALHSGDTSAP